ncbi:unnamed protein product [Acanthoscelides obtectus]|uniref:Sm domain-containing protein n=1 Tax=Acanthoscelides obtectus TaxID=200917 RepID=A0A9P0L0C6_ACAOB|nr:unnamed protein product [Acanthoscelides obtectus]CAK1633684.1 Small nuclear ribonucleoprotein Sm D-like protein [Acanthoscelides obtectus]
MDAIVGPLAFLKKCREERTRIKVYTRDERSVRGFCMAYLLAFDKHWNLLLEEVEEHWTRKRLKKVPALDTVELSKKPKTKIRPPDIRVAQHETDKKLENCSREVCQLMMRGEHVVFITIA